MKAGEGLSALGLSQDLEQVQRRATYAYLLAYTVPLTVTSALALLREDRALGVTLGFFATAACIILLWVNRRGLNTVVRVITVGAVATLYLYLVTSGGYENTALLWGFTMFVVIVHFSSALAGLTINLSLLGISAILLFVPRFSDLHPAYDAALSNRFIVTGTITCILLYVYAHVQEILKERLKQTQDQLLAVSLTDELTGLTNRRSMNDVLCRENRRTEGERTLAVVLADVDEFKAINDTLGHDAGDQVLIHISTVLRGSLREADRVARWGGEEFLILLDVLDVDQASVIIERVRKTIESTPVVYQGEPVEVTISFGMRLVGNTGESMQQAISEADRNLLHAKELGRNRVVVS